MVAINRIKEPSRIDHPYRNRSCFPGTHRSFNNVNLGHQLEVGGDKNLLFHGKTVLKCHLGVKGKNRNIGGIRLDCSPEIVQEYRLG